MSRALLYRVGRGIVNIFARRLLRLDVVYQAKLPAGAKIIVPNHPTTLDPFLMTLLTEERVYILITESAFKAPLLGAYLRHTGHIPVISGQGTSALAAAVRLLKAGETVVIFPEGCLSPLDGSCSRAHTGAVRLASLTGAPIIPVGIQLESEHIRHVNTGITTADGKTETARLYLRGRYAITIGAPMRLVVGAEERARVVELSEQMMTRIHHLSRQSAYRIQTAAAQPIRSTSELPGMG